MKKLLFAAAVAFACSAGAQEQDAPNQPVTFVFLNTGAARSNASRFSQETLAKMQAEHVGNFGTQFNLGTLMAAGPLGDNGFIRGIVILSPAAQVAECFKPDPFVHNGLLDVEAHPWQVDVMKLGTPKVPFELARHTLCILKKGKNWTPASSPGNSASLLRLTPALQELAKSGELAIGGPFTDAGDKLGLLLFYSTNQALIQEQLGNDPAGAEGRVQLEFHPQFMGRGTLRDPGVDTSAPKPGRTRSLFDGSTFEGWEGDTQHTWRIDHGALVGGSLTETVPHNDFLSTRSEFRNFDLRLKVRLTGTGFVNGGIQFRSQRLKDPAFEMTGYQADMGESYWGSLYDESRRNRALAHTHATVIRRLVKPNDWNEYVIRCEGPRIRLWFNGVLTVDYTESDKEIPLEGHVGLQIHGGGKAEAAYREITLEELP